MISSTISTHRIPYNPLEDWTMSLPPSFAGLWLENATLQLRRHLPLPDLAPGEALIRTRLAGICGTDLELTRGYYPYAGVPGHEFVGQVVSCPDRPQLKGARVVGEINAACHACPTCAAGRTTHCPTRTVLGIVNRQGVFGRYFTLPARNLHVVPDGLTDEVAVFTEPLAAALRILEQVQISADSRVCLVGAGRLGQLVARVLHGTGCQLQVLDPSARARASMQAAGIGAVDHVPPGEADFVVEASGSPAGFEAARAAVRPGGTIVAKSTYHGQLTFDYSALVVDEITVVGSRCGPFAPALEMLASGALDPTPLIQARYGLDRGVAAMDEAAKPGATKVLLEID